MIVCVWTSSRWPLVDHQSNMRTCVCLFFETTGISNFWFQLKVIEGSLVIVIAYFARTKYLVIVHSLMSIRNAWKGLFMTGQSFERTFVWHLLLAVCRATVPEYSEKKTLWGILTLKKFGWYTQGKRWSQRGKPLCFMKELTANNNKELQPS